MKGSRSGETKQLWVRSVFQGRTGERTVMCRGCGGQWEPLGLLSEGSHPLGAISPDACGRGMWAV